MLRPHRRGDSPRKKPRSSLSLCLNQPEAPQVVMASAPGRHRGPTAARTVVKTSASAAFLLPARASQ
jgi:hypothetical protein